MPLDHMVASKSRWKFSFRRSSSLLTKQSSSSIENGNGGAEASAPAPPMSFICPISSSLMYDPVILVPSGHTLERACIQACTDLNFIPPSLQLPSSDSSSSTTSTSSSLFLIPNVALKDAIIDWCDRLSLPHPSPISHESAIALVQNLIFTTHPPPPTSYSSFSSSSSSSNSISTSNSSLEHETPKILLSTTSPSMSIVVADPLEESIHLKLKSPNISVKESGLIALRHSARDGGSHCRASLCTPRILAALVPVISLSNPTIQVNATAAIVNLSIDPPANKVKIVRAGAVPALVEALKQQHSEEARHNAAGALFSLALEDENKLAIGVLGGIPPLVNLFCEESESAGGSRVGREEAGMALYHLSLASNNLSKIAKTPGAVKAMLNIATAASGDASGGLRLQRVSMMVLASLARKNEGRAALMDANAIKAMVGLMEQEDSTNGKEEEYCLGVLYEMSKGSLRFRALAKAAGAERVLLADRGRGEVAKKMATRILKVIRGDHYDTRMTMTAAAFMTTLRTKKQQDQDDDDDNDEIASVVSDGMVSFRRRRFDDFGGTRGSGAGASASNSANF